jgi:hypothetical protein
LFGFSSYWLIHLLDTVFPVFRVEDIYNITVLPVDGLFIYLIQSPRNDQNN